MLRWAGVLVFCCVAGPAAGQDSNFESADYGVRLKIPAGWDIDATRQQRVILKLNQAVDALVKPELLVYEAPFAEPITVAQYKEQLRHFVQRAFKEPWMRDDRPATAAGKQGFILEVESKGTGDADLVSIKGVFQVSPRRMIGIDGVFPRAQAEALAKVYEAFLATVEFIPRKTPAGAEEGLRSFEQAFPKLALPSALTKPEAEELGIFMGDKRVGTYTVGLKPAVRGTSEGLEVQAYTKIELGEDGRVETRINGFLSNDLAHQTVELAESKVGKEKRAQNFTSLVTLSNGEVRCDRRINGEKSEARFSVPPRSVLSELAEALLARLTGPEKGVFSVRSVGAFENEPGIIKIEVTGAHKMKTGEDTRDVTVSFLQREDGSLLTYWHDTDRRTMRVTLGNQSLVIKRIDR